MTGGFNHQFNGQIQPTRPCRPAHGSPHKVGNLAAWGAVATLIVPTMGNIHPMDQPQATHPAQGLSTTGLWHKESSYIRFSCHAVPSFLKQFCSHCKRKNLLWHELKTFQIMSDMSTAQDFYTYTYCIWKGPTDMSDNWCAFLPSFWRLRQQHSGWMSEKKVTGDIHKCQ